MTAAQLQAASGPVVIVLIILLTLAMAFRIIRHVLSRRRTPLLLARDFLLFASLVVLISGSQYARATGIRLSDELWWIALTNGLSIVTAGLWLFIEVAIIGRDRGDDR